MLGQHLGCHKNALRRQGTFRHNALSVPEQIRKYAFVLNRHIVHKVSRHKVDFQAVLALLNRSSLHHSANAKMQIIGNFTIGDLRRRVEHIDILAQGEQSQTGSSAHAQRDKSNNR